MPGNIATQSPSRVKKPTRATRGDRSEREAQVPAKGKDGHAQTAPLPLRHTTGQRHRGRMEEGASEPAQRQQHDEHSERRRESDEAEKEAGHDRPESHQPTPTHPVGEVSHDRLGQGRSQRQDHAQHGRERDGQAQLVHETRQKRVQEGDVGVVGEVSHRQGQREGERAPAARRRPGRRRGGGWHRNRQSTPAIRLRRSMSTTSRQRPSWNRPRRS